MNTADKIKQIEEEIEKLTTPDLLHSAKYRRVRILLQEYKELLIELEGGE